MKSSWGKVWLAVALFVSICALPVARAQQQATPSSQPASESAAESAKSAKEDKPTAPATGIGGDLAKETREAAGEDQENQEENVALKHARPVRWLANKIDWSVHGTHLLLSGLNFAIIAAIAIWAARKYLPGMFRNRTALIQQALQEARAASQDANRRLADIETRLRQLDVEIGRMQASAENEAAAEDVRIQKAAEEEIRKVALAAEQEIATAAKLARRDLSTHTANLAIALARQQIHVDGNTDQVLVRSFASKLATPAASHNVSSLSDSNHDGGKDGR